MRPKISIGIPTYNLSRFLKKTIKSILNQDEKNFELIIVDDCSTDNTEQVVKSFKDTRIIYLKTNKNLKPPAVYNVPLRVAKGKFFILLDHDDILLPEYLSKMSKILENNISLGYVQCNFIEIDSMDKIISNNFNDYKTAVLKKTEALDWQFKYLDCKPAAIMLNLDVVNEIKERWTENFWDDWAFYLRIAYKKGMIIIPDILCCIRKHDEQLNVKLINSKDNIQDYYLDQLINVIGVMQPFGLNSSKIFKKQIRDISLSYFFYSIKFFLRFKFRLFYRNFKIANNLNPFILCDWKVFQKVIFKIFFKHEKYQIKNYISAETTLNIKKILSKTN